MKQDIKKEQSAAAEAVRAEHEFRAKIRAIFDGVVDECRIDFEVDEKDRVCMRFTASAMLHYRRDQLTAPDDRYLRDAYRTLIALVAKLVGEIQAIEKRVEETGPALILPGKNIIGG